MNFYQLYNLINEYGQSLIETLTQKFQQEVPTLTPTIIRNYIDRFDRIKNNLEEKDITKYTWKQLENTVDGYQPKQRIKAGKLDPTVSDANLLYNQDGTRIYLGKNKKSCIRYGNGYTFCISARGENNMYAQYRIRDKGTPYFIFNDNLPTEDNRHLMVLFVYQHGTVQYAKRYSVTLATNQPEDEKEYGTLAEITNLYPWTKPLENFIDDKTKGAVDVEPIEILEDWLTESFNFKNYKLRLSLKNHEQMFILELLSKDGFLKKYNKLKDILSDEKKNLISMSVTRGFRNKNNYRSSIDIKKFDEYETLDELKDDLIKTTELMNKTVLEEGGDEYKDKKGLEEYIRTSAEVFGAFNSIEKTYPDFGFLLRYPEEGYGRKHQDTFVIRLYVRSYIQQILKESPVIEPLADLHKEYYSNLNWLNQRTSEETKTMLDKINELNAKADASHKIRLANTTEFRGWKTFDDAFNSFKKLF
jgi:hypothetical protein